MKKLFIILSVCAFGLGMSSCADWLEMPSYTSTDTQIAFNSELTADMYVQGCYRGLVHSESFYQYGMGDTAMHSSEDGTTNNSKYNICNYYLDTTTPTTLSLTYQEQFRIIEACNIAISALPKMAETAKRNAMLGEVLAIRAFCYLTLIRFYGDVPAVWRPLDEMDPEDENTLYPKRTSRDVIYDRIIADLKTAIGYLPWYSAADYGAPERFSKQAAYALLARVALYAGGYSLRWDLETNDPATLKMARRSDEARVRELYQIASDACEAVKAQGENSLIQAQGDMSGFHNLWYNYCQRNFTATDKEMLFQIAEYGSVTNSDFGGYAHTGTRGGKFGSYKAMQFMLPTYYLSFDSRDTRRDVTCTSYSIYFLEDGKADDTWVDVGTTYSCIMHGKFRHNWRVQLNASKKYNIDIPILRYADVLLMYAEAQNFLNGGPTQAAKDALQEVRDRAGIGSLAMPSSQQEFEDALAQERKWEFAGEFMLRTDLIRMGRLAKEVAAAQQAIKDLSDRTGDYEHIPVYRLYKYKEDAQEWGDNFLSLEYIDLTEPAEIELAKAVPTDKSDYAAFQTTLSGIVAAHGKTVNADDKWYPANMFEAYNSTFNGNARKAVGFGKGFNALQIGKIIYTKPTGSAENGGTYPDWVAKSDGSDGLYYGFEENKTELLPFANKSSGHPMVDNPNLTQHPGYL